MQACCARMQVRCVPGHEHTLWKAMLLLSPGQPGGSLEIYQSPSGKQSSL